MDHPEKAMRALTKKRSYDTLHAGKYQRANCVKKHKPFVNGPTKGAHPLVL
jgi:hypothetical protein